MNKYFSLNFGILLSFFFLIQSAYADTNVRFSDYFTRGFSSGNYDNSYDHGFNIPEDSSLLSPDNSFVLKDGETIFLKKIPEDWGIAKVKIDDLDLTFSEWDGMEISLRMSNSGTVVSSNSGCMVSIANLNDSYGNNFNMVGNIAEGIPFSFKKTSDGIIIKGLTDLNLKFLEYSVDGYNGYKLSKLIPLGSDRIFYMNTVNKQLFVNDVLIPVDTKTDVFSDGIVRELYRPSLKDIDDSFAKDMIRYFYDYRYVNGYGKGLFKPNNPITRAEFLKIAMSVFGRIEEDDLNVVSDGSFSDTSGWSVGVAQKAKAAGYVSGRNGKFRPNDPITRAEAMKIVTNISGADLSAYGYLRLSESYFSDVIEHWMVRYLNYAKDNGTVDGRDGKFRPNDPITRAEAVKVIYNTDGW